ncbi:MAG: CDF family Co(II)/Ni(II) efflux transporter DmeF [Halothiobacillaceae bacterium]|nr:CDF family Co(II)/Ni(II) efflux transporter DmeF [Halothiobacillaceae bacterium]
MSEEVTAPLSCRCGPEHNHNFGQGERRRAEGRLWGVAFITLIVMVVEILAGWLTGSMALLGDGIHMGGHALALGLAAAAYYLARRYASDRRLSLGSGKINDLAAYTSALLLGVATVWLVVESVSRLLQPGELHAQEALLVAVLGLVVNLVSAWILVGAEEGGHHHAHVHDHGHDHDHDHGHDHNLRAALLHVMADAVTSLAAIVGLAAAWLWGWVWLDPLIALVAAALILRWSVDLLRRTGAILLDAEAPETLRHKVIERLEEVGETQVTDLHLWSVGQGQWTLVAAVRSQEPAQPETYKSRLSDLSNVHHPVVEVSFCMRCRHCDEAAC